MSILASFLGGQQAGQQQMAHRQEQSKLAQLKSLAPQVISGDAGAYAQAAALDPKAAQEYQAAGDSKFRKLGGFIDYVEGARKTGNIAAVNAALAQGAPFIEQLTGKPGPTAWTEDMEPGWEALKARVAMARAGQGGNNVQSTYINAQGKRMAIMRDGSQQELGDANQSIRVMEQEGAMPYGVVTSGGVAGQTVQLGAGQQQGQPTGAYIDPSLPPEVQAQIRQSIAAGQEPPGQMVFSGGAGASGPVRTPTAGEKAAATERAKLQAQQDFLPAELSMRTDADIAKSRGIEQAKSEQERASNERAKTAQLNNVDRGLSRIDTAIKALSGGMVNTGPLDGRLMVSTPQGQELEAAVGAIQNDMLALTRVPGIGSQSDLEAKIANLKYPSIYNHPSVNEANVNQLKAFMEDLRNQITGQAASQHSVGASPSARQRTVVRTGTSNGRKVIQYSDGSVEYGN